jgi:hypothetical protein
VGLGWHSLLAPPAWQRQAITASRWKIEEFRSIHLNVTARPKVRLEGSTLFRMAV